MAAKRVCKRDAYNTINQFSTNFQSSSKKLLQMEKSLPTLKT